MTGDHLHIVTHRFPIESELCLSHSRDGSSTLTYLVNLSLRQTKVYGERSEKWFGILDYQDTAIQGNQESIALGGITNGA